MQRGDDLHVTTNLAASDLNVNRETQAVEQGTEASRRWDRDMRVITFRPLEQTDTEVLSRLFARLSEESLYRRFMSPVHRLDQVHLRRLLDIDHKDREAIIGLLGGEAIGVGRYARTASASAEFAVVVADRFQRLGVAGELLSRLAILALARGITEFTFTAHSENLPIIGLVRKLVKDPTLKFTGPEVEGRFEIIDLAHYSPGYPVRELDDQAGAGARMEKA